MLIPLVCLIAGLLIGAIFGWLVTSWRFRTHPPDDLTMAYLMGREDERKVQVGKKPDVELDNALALLRTLMGPSKSLDEIKAKYRGRP